TSPTADDSNIVNNHRLHIKNTLYLFSGIGFLCFFIAFSAGMIVDLWHEHKVMMKTAKKTTIKSFKVLLSTYFPFFQQ
ncbi:MAG TPA: hypothetical protein VHT73_16790, partial [Thermodesulfobacteriota bacterium]|nr:hypothetical protein [Thermodesulfobacteriota bacterium]